MLLGDSNDQNNFLHNLLLTKTQVSNLSKPFANGSSVNIKISKAQLHKTEQSGGFSGRHLRLMKNDMQNVLKPLAKSVLIRLGLTAVASATDAAIHKCFDQVLQH